MAPFRVVASLVAGVDPNAAVGFVAANCKLVLLCRAVTSQLRIGCVASAQPLFDVTVVWCGASRTLPGYIRHHGDALL